MTEVVAQVQTKCPTCQTTINLEVTEQDLSIKGKNIKCSCCQAVLWITLTLEENQIIPRSNFSFIVLV